MNKQLVDALEICLRALEKGETLDAVLKRYPHLAEKLLPLLESAQAARTMGQSAVPQNAQTRSRVRVLSAAARLREARAPQRRIGRTWRAAFVTLAVVAFLALSGNGLLTASAHSLPGDILYPLKRTVEDAQLTFSSGPVQRQQLQEEFKQRRVQEAESLIMEGRVESVEFSGVVTAQTPDGWMVDGISVIVAPQTQVNGTIAIGMEVKVIGKTQADGNVQAAELIFDNGGGDGNPDGAPGGAGSPGGSPGSESQKTEMPEPTGLHGSDHGGTPTPELTNSHQNNEVDASHTPKPNESHGSGGTGTPTPEPTELPEPTESPENQATPTPTL